VQRARLAEAEPGTLHDHEAHAGFHRRWDSKGRSL